MLTFCVVGSNIPTTILFQYCYVLPSAEENSAKYFLFNILSDLMFHIHNKQLDQTSQKQFAKIRNEAATGKLFSVFIVKNYYMYRRVMRVTFKLNDHSNYSNMQQYGALHRNINKDLFLQWLSGYL